MIGPAFEPEMALEMAWGLSAVGAPAIPVNPRTKKPTLERWEQFQTRIPTDDELQLWFGNGNPRRWGVAVVTGRLSGWVVLDGDNGPKNGRQRKGIGELFHLGAYRAATRRVETPSRGVHLYFQHPGHGEIPNSTGANGWFGKQFGTRDIDVRGDGGYVVVWAPGYRVRAGALPTILPAEFRPPVSAKGHKPPADERWVTDLMQGVRYGERDSACARLAGYFLSTGLPPDVVESILVPFAQRCDQPPGEPFGAADVHKVVDSITKAERAKTEDTDDDWAPTDLVELRNEPELQRFGLGRMLYRGRVHWLQGDPDMGKSFLAYAHAVSEMHEGRTVLLLDEDAGASDAESKLRALGATDEMFTERLVYLRPAGRNLVRDRARLLRLVAERSPSLVIVDAAADHLDAAGLNEDKAPDVTKFVREALKPLAHRFDAAVVVVDHKTKANPDGRDARGSGAKLAKTDAAYNVFAPEPFSRDRSGRIHVVCTKDKPGFVGRDTSWMLHVDVGQGGNRVRLHAGEPLSSEQTREMLGKARQKGVAAKIVATLAESLLPMETGEIVDAVGRSRPTVSGALNGLERDGVVEHDKGDRPNQKRWRLVEGGAQSSTVD